MAAQPPIPHSYKYSLESEISWMLKRIIMTGIRKNHGFSIIELLVAMGISLLLLAGIATMFVSSKGTYEINDRLARLEENGRFALDTMARTINNAGYSGCSGASMPYIVVNDPNHAMSDKDLTDKAVLDQYQNPANADQYSQMSCNNAILSPPVQGFNYTSTGSWTPALNAGIATPVDGSDVLMLQGTAADGVPIPLNADMSTTLTDPIFVAPGTTSINLHQQMMIADCSARTYFEVTGYDPSTGEIDHAQSAPGTDGGGNHYNGNRDGSLFNRYFKTSSDPNAPGRNGGANIYSSLITVFFVDWHDTTTNDHSKDHKSLWRVQNGNTQEELIEGVDSMQLLYGLDEDGDGTVDQYTPTLATISDARKVASITIALLVSSVDEYGSVVDKNSYDLLGASDPTAVFPAQNDHHLRQVFTTTVAVRNRIPCS